MSLLERIDAALNPIWVKELRQSLRSRLFRVAFLATLLFAATFSDLALGNTGDSLGQHLFEISYGVLTATVVGLVPFYAFYASPGEGQARALDLVQLTGLSPWRIATGRLLMALTQIGLFYSAFLPFMAVAALLPGIDLVAASLTLAGTALAATTATAVAIALGAILHSRLIRAVVGILLAGVLFYVAAGTGVAGVQLLEHPESVSTTEFRTVVLSVLAVMALIGAYGMAGAAAALTHPEGNRSTTLRLVTLAAAILGLGLVALVADPTHVSADEAAAGSMVIIALLGVPLGVFLVEPDRLGRRVAAQLPHTAAAIVFAPFLPGGRRGLSFAVFLLAGVAAASGLVIRAYADADTRALVYEVPWLTVAYGLIYLLIPAMLLRRWIERPGVRWLALLAMPGLCLLSVVAPMIAGLLVNSYALRQGRHLGNPFYVVMTLLRDGHPADGTELVMALALLLVLLGLPRMMTGYIEVIRACERRDARSA